MYCGVFNLNIVPPPAVTPADEYRDASEALFTDSLRRTNTARRNKKSVVEGFVKEKVKRDKALACTHTLYGDFLILSLLVNLFSSFLLCFINFIYF
jgi:hypothetical protein